MDRGQGSVSATPRTGARSDMPPRKRNPATGDGDGASGRVEAGRIDSPRSTKRPRAKQEHLKGQLDLIEWRASGQALMTAARTKPRTTVNTIAEIDKSHCSRLRVSIDSWRGTVLVDVRECTANIPGCYWPTSMGVRISIEQLPELIRALEKAREAAR
jgi:Transcriptional Coactivator p15 (PC4)